MTRRRVCISLAILFMTVVLLGQPDSTAQDQPAEELFKLGETELSHGHYAKAREQFDMFLKLYPDHSLSANAHFLKGQSWYSEKNFDKAIGEFEIVATNINDPQAPVALLRIGNSYNSKNDYAHAIMAFWRIIDFYPDSHLIPMARKKIEQLSKKMESSK